MASHSTQSVANRALLLHPDDTVLICVQPIAAGDQLEIDGLCVDAPQAVDVGHKLARRALHPGDKVLKHGAPIGSITRLTACGEHVHAHNMQSDYIQSHTREMQSHPSEESGDPHV